MNLAEACRIFINVFGVRFILFVYVRIHIYIYIYIYVRTYTYIYIYIYVRMLLHICDAILCRYISSRSSISARTHQLELTRLM